jgi:hypothetical protein
MMLVFEAVRCQQAQSGLADVGLHLQHGSGASIRREPPPKMKRRPWRGGASDFDPAGIEKITMNSWIIPCCKAPYKAAQDGSTASDSLKDARRPHIANCLIGPACSIDQQEGWNGHG